MNDNTVDVTAGWGHKNQGKESIDRGRGVRQQWIHGLIMPNDKGILAGKNRQNTEICAVIAKSHSFSFFHWPLEKTHTLCSDSQESLLQFLPLAIGENAHIVQ
jgi:hypothetical protein